MIKNITLACL